MRQCLQFYINGAWVDPIESRTLDVINPATERVAGRVSVGSKADVDAAVAAARSAFARYSATGRAERLELLEHVLEQYHLRYAEMSAAITEEMGAPIQLSQQAQARTAVVHLQTAIEVFRTYSFEEELRGGTLIAREPIGVCGFITPWNWPVNQMVAKIAPALACGCTIVIKPSEIAPFSGYLLTQIMHAAGVPQGVFNMVNGDGPTVGAHIAAHSDIDMVSFTGSTRAGIEVARNAAPTVKRVHQELGGKSANIILKNVDLRAAVIRGVQTVMRNSGQSCNAPTRMLVPKVMLGDVMDYAREAASAITVGDPNGSFQMGPVASENQWHKVQGYIRKGLEEGATLVTGGLGRPDGLDEGYYVKPTVFANVTPDMTIAKEEIFGPVLAILAYETQDQAVAIANHTEYGLAAYVQGSDAEEVRKIASRLRAGQVILNGAGADFTAPFGGYKRSGNGREWGEHAFNEFLETKAVIGYGRRDP